MVQLSVTLLFVPAVVIAVSSLFFGRAIMDTLYQAHVDNSADILGLLMMGFPGIAATYIFGTLLTANGSLKQLNLMAAGGMVLNIALNLLLIPVWKALGSAWASMVTQLMTGLAQMLIAWVIFRLRVPSAFLVKLAVFILFTLLAGYLFSRIPDTLAGYLLAVALPLFFAVLIKLVNLGDLVRIIQKES